MVTNINADCIAITGYYECGGDPHNPKWLSAYLDRKSGVPTIGIGTTRYPNGKAVKLGDTITAQLRDECFLFDMKEKVQKINFLTRDDITQSQFNGVVDLSYNIGTTNFQKSALLKTLNNNLLDPSLVDRFYEWRCDNGEIVTGLIKRRMTDAFHYFTGKLKYDWKFYGIADRDNSIKEVHEAIRQFA